MTSHIEYKDGRKPKPHINVGTIGHIDHGFSKISKGIDHGFSKISKGMAINTGDYIDPAPWEPEDHERFKKAMARVRNSRTPE
tara:strand:- start:693 stop:941 length:249 start_codon:yes stop_codon:yes gene_type:complete